MQVVALNWLRFRLTPQVKSEYLWRASWHICTLSICFYIILNVVGGSSRIINVKSKFMISSMCGCDEYSNLVWMKLCYGWKWNLFITMWRRYNMTKITGIRNRLRKIQSFKKICREGESERVWFLTKLDEAEYNWNSPTTLDAEKISNEDI